MSFLLVRFDRRHHSCVATAVSMARVVFQVPAIEWVNDVSNFLFKSRLCQRTDNQLDDSILSRSENEIIF